MLKTHGKPDKYKSYWVNCINKLNQVETLQEHEAAYGYYVTKKWHHKRKFMMGVPDVNPKKAKKSVRNIPSRSNLDNSKGFKNSKGLETPFRNSKGFENSNNSQAKNAENSLIPGHASIRGASLHDLNENSDFEIKYVISQKSISELYLNTGRAKLLPPEFSEYEQMRRIDLYNIDTYPELEEELHSVVEAQMNLCFGKFFIFLKSRI